MIGVSEKLNEIITQFTPKLRKLNQSEWSYRTAPEKWSKKEILGHLIDSAANNHQRFIRVQLENIPTIVYNPDDWNSTQIWNDASIETMLQLFTSYNKHLAYIISIFSEEKKLNKCNIAKDTPATIEWIIDDYIRHLQHHLNQIT